VPRYQLCLLILMLPLIVGCEGCRQDPAADDPDKQAEQSPLEDFTATVPSPFPADLNSISGGIKPGHWLTASQPLKSNKFDSRGELLSEISVTAQSVSAGGLATGGLATGGVAMGGDTTTSIPTLRPVVLPQGQLRRFDYRLLAPIPLALDQKKSFLSSRFVSVGRTAAYETGRQPFNVLAGQEFFFVVLSTRPERFAKFQVAYWVEPPRDEYKFQDFQANYQIVIPSVDDLLPLAETMLDWTATAVLFWDDLAADALTPAQQTAVADWIHFGGQLIINGADGAESIATTALADVLPLRPTGNIELDPQAAIALLRGHAVAGDMTTEKQISLVNDRSARLAVDGIAAQDAEAVTGTGELVLERQIGRGRVVQTRFDLTSDWLSTWDSYDSFINGVVMRRPRREYSVPAAGLAVQQRYPDWWQSDGDATLNSRFRIAARDAILPTPVAPAPPAGAVVPTLDPVLDPPAVPVTAAPLPETASALASRYDVTTQINSVSGLSGWNDSSDVVSLYRRILRDESGIEIPDSALVLRSLAYYLIILVPLNYVVFRLLGRLEYAWLAVPLIAIGGAIWVARVARLDIGFARSQTQVALLELQPGYDRGHLSRIVAIYNSLSSSYDIEFDTADAAAMPIRNKTDTQEETVFKLGFAEGPILSGVAVGSNQVRMLHSEQIVDVGGTVEWTDENELINRTEYDLLDAYVVEKSSTGTILMAAVGQLDRGSAMRLRLRDAGEIMISDQLPMQTGQVIRRLTNSAALPTGSRRLVARIDGALPGMAITPAANQTLSQTVVLVHLKHPPLPAPQVDVNLVSSFRDVLTDKQAAENATEIPAGSIE
jgi:hypothetical protein